MITVNRFVLQILLLYLHAVGNVQWPQSVFWYSHNAWISFHRCASIFCRSQFSCFRFYIAQLGLFLAIATLYLTIVTLYLTIRPFVLSCNYIFHLMRLVETSSYNWPICLTIEPVYLSILTSYNCNFRLHKRKIRTFKKRTQKFCEWTESFSEEPKHFASERNVSRRIAKHLGFFTIAMSLYGLHTFQNIPQIDIFHVLTRFIVQSYDVIIVTLSVCQMLMDHVHN